MQLHLTHVQRYDKDKDGKPLVTKDNRPYTRLVIKATEYGDKLISGFDSMQTRDWKEGVEVEAEVEQKGEYLNFKVLNKTDKLAENMELILNKLTLIGLKVDEIGKHIVPKPKDDYPEMTEEPIF